MCQVETAPTEKAKKVFQLWKLDGNSIISKVPNLILGVDSENNLKMQSGTNPIAKLVSFDSSGRSGDPSDSSYKFAIEARKGIFTKKLHYLLLTLIIIYNVVFTIF